MGKRTDKQIRSAMMKLRDELDVIETAKVAKKRKVLVGKCFVYDNGYSHDQRWPLYSRVLAVNDSGWLTTLRCQTDCHGKLEIEQAELTSEGTLGTEISLETYQKALKDAQAQFNKLLVVGTIG